MSEGAPVDRTRRLRDGQPPVGREGARARRRARARERRSRASARDGRAGRARRRRVSRGRWPRSAPRASTSCCSSGPRRACRCWGSAWGCSCCSRAPRSSAARRDWGSLAGTVRRLTAPGLKLPQIGWNEVRWQRPTPLLEGLRDPAYLPRAQLRPRAADEERAGKRRVRRALRVGRRAGKRVRHAVPPGEVLRARARAARQLHAAVRSRGGAGVKRTIPVPDVGSRSLIQSGFAA